MTGGALVDWPEGSAQRPPDRPVWTTDVIIHSEKDRRIMGVEGENWFLRSRGLGGTEWGCDWECLRGDIVRKDVVLKKNGKGTVGRKQGWESR